jgi:hypothetical protein
MLLKHKLILTLKDVVNRWSWFGEEDEQIFFCIKHNLPFLDDKLLAPGT